MVANMRQVRLKRGFQGADADPENDGGPFDILQPGVTAREMGGRNGELRRLFHHVLVFRLDEVGQAKLRKWRVKP